MGSLEGLIALRQGLGHVAGCHLLDPETGEFNRSYAKALFPGRAELITLAHREQGLMCRRAIRAASRAGRGGSAGRAHREPQSRLGTRVWLDRMLAAPTSSHRESPATSARSAPMRRRRGGGGWHRRRGARASAGGARSGLEFIPLLEERYDLVTPREHYRSALLAPLLALLNNDEFKRAIDGLGGYATRETGRRGSRRLTGCGVERSAACCFRPRSRPPRRSPPTRRRARRIVRRRRRARRACRARRCGRRQQRRCRPRSARCSAGAPRSRSCDR